MYTKFTFESNAKYSCVTYVTLFTQRVNITTVTIALQIIT